MEGFRFVYQIPWNRKFSIVIHDWLAQALCSQVYLRKEEKISRTQSPFLFLSFLLSSLLLFPLLSNSKG
ncbi:hypothetical protein Hdeb2414_s0007g00241841 [Helianthus debilis subsp. tardiflorus]